ncbi:unnamed protein product [Pleuronectes platessa]|uniref:Uncharacterized protein n=1 Tax=Pleuronectes platessa TaxID=8262 RepID=A0A9N7U7M0_PLEPL|nr:unnamed protein product [Pleuronectes platessa]
MAVRLYRAAANRGAPIRASLRCARPIRCADQDPCLRVVQRCGHVTLGEGMPTWTRGKDGMCERATTITRRRRKERPRYSERSTALRSSAEPRKVFVLRLLGQVSSTSSSLCLACINGVSQQQNAESGE